MGITCPKYVPGVGTARCEFYYDEYPDLAGACIRDDEFMCVEWMKRYAWGWEDTKGRVHPVDADGVVHITPKPQL